MPYFACFSTLNTPISQTKRPRHASSRFVDDVANRAPHAEGIVFRHTDARIVGIGGHEPSFVAFLHEALERVLAVEFTHGHFVFRGVAVALVHNDDVAGVDVGIDHGVALHADEVARLGVGAKHTQQFDVLAALVVVERYGKTCHDGEVEKGQCYVADRCGVHGTKRIGALHCAVLFYAGEYELRFVALCTDDACQWSRCTEREELAVGAWTSATGG